MYMWFSFTLKSPCGTLGTGIPQTKPQTNGGARSRAQVLLTFLSCPLQQGLKAVLVACLKILRHFWILLIFSSLLFRRSHLQAVCENDKQKLKHFETTPVSTELQERSSRPHILAQFRETKNTPSCLNRKMVVQVVPIGAGQLHVAWNPV